MYKVRGTFLEFVKRNNLLPLLPIFLASTTVQGYGHLGRISALYGLIWNTPKVMKGFLKRLNGQKNSGMYMLKSGFQNLWKTIAKKESLNVTFNVDIYKVYRTYSGNCQGVWMCKKEGSTEPKWEHYDFLIWSPEMKTSLQQWRNKIPDEKKYFSVTKPSYFTSSIVNSENVKRGQTPIDYWIDNILSGDENCVWSQRDSYSAINQYKGPLYVNGSFPTGDDTKSTKTTIAYQMNDQQANKDDLKKRLHKHFNSLNGTDLEVIHMKTWRYFPRYSPEDMEKGYLWRILEMQGKYGMWYIGSSVSFESVKSVVEYNKLLVKNMKMPSANIVY